MRDAADTLLPLRVRVCSAQLCTALQAEIEDYKKHSSTAAAGRSPGGRSIMSTGGVAASAAAAAGAGGASAAAVAELEQQLQSAQAQASQLQRELEQSRQEADRTMTELRAQRAEERNTLANAQAELAQVRGCISWMKWMSGMAAINNPAAAAVAAGGFLNAMQPLACCVTACWQTVSATAQLLHPLTRCERQHLLL